MSNRRINFDLKKLEHVVDLIEKGEKDYLWILPLPSTDYEETVIPTYLLDKLELLKQYAEASNKYVATTWNHVSYGTILRVSHK